MDQAHVQRMFADLSRRGIEASTYAPPIYKLARKFGFNPIPPLFAPFMSNVLWLGSYFGICMGAFLWLMHRFMPSPHHMPDWGVVLLVVLAGLSFGVCMGWWFRHTANKHGLPSWERYCRELGGNAF